MADSNYSGYKLLEYEASPASWGGSEVSLGTPLADSPGEGREVQEVENAKGQQLYAGLRNDSEWNVDDLTKFSALETLMKADTEVDVRITDMEDTTRVIHTNAMVKVKKNYSAAVGGRNTLNVKFSVFEV